MMDKLKELISLCKAGIHVSINEHRDYYESVEQNLSEDERKDIEPEVLEEMIKRDTIISVQAYPDTPVGFYSVYHYDLDAALSDIINTIKTERQFR